ncbi:MAG TPA: zf-HC2 domain-containing protein [Gemmatimonadaceae bacterium]|nr:zf-HC2 domain-containing protein [Gemmatimonadaceae bacterium]
MTEHQSQSGAKPAECQYFEMHVPALLEGEAAPELRRALEEHLGRCADCSALYGDLREIAARAASLPLLRPQRDLWPEIAARLDEKQPSETALLPRRRRAVRTALWPALAAAMALAAVALGTSLRARMQSAVASAPDSAGQPVVASNSAQARNVTGGAFDPQVVYGSELARLEVEFELRRSGLDSTTVAVVERNLATIDSAIAAARSAMASDPGSYFLARQLEQALAKKLNLMRRVVLTSGI